MEEKKIRRFEAESHQVPSGSFLRLPFMGPSTGNAFAQIKAARERELQRQQQATDQNKVAIPRKGHIMSISSRPNSGRSSSGLDYDADLALPMPKPRYLADPASPRYAGSQQTEMKPYVTKKRSMTEPSRPVGNIEKKDDGEKKRSKVASLRAKFSIKDTSGGIRKDSALTCPIKSEPDNDESVHQSLENIPHFEEERLYVPKTRQPGVYPQSAPPFQTTTPFRDSVGSSQASVASVASARQPTQKDDVNAAKLMKFYAEGKGKRPTRDISGLFFEEARAGACSNNRQPEIVAQKSIPSLRAEREPGSSPFSLNVTVLSAEPGAAYCSPVHNTLMQEESLLLGSKDNQLTYDNEGEGEKHVSAAMSSDQRKGFSFGFQEGKRLTSQSSVLSSNPQTPRVSFEDDVLSSAGVTSRGGYAPAPPHPGYQNTMTIEQQLLSHVDSLHHHMDKSVARVTKTFESNHNLVTNQIMTKAENMADLARLMELRSVNQKEVVDDLKQFMDAIWAQVNSIQQEARQMEERLVRTFQVEIAELRAEILNAGIPCKPAKGSKTAATELQGTQQNAVATKGTKDNEKRGKKKSQVWKKGDAVSGGGKEEHRNKEGGESVFVGENSSLNKHAEQQTSIDAIPKASTSFCTPRINESVNQSGTEFTSIQRQQSTRKNPAQESSGSPESKNANLNEHILTRGALSSCAPKLEQVPETDRQPNTQDAKTTTPHRKGMFGFRSRRSGDGYIGSSRFLRTPRKSKENSKASEEQSADPSTPPVPPIPMNFIQQGNAQRSRKASPSGIHPLHRTDTQKQIMEERQRLNWLSKSNHSTHNVAASSFTSSKDYNKRALRNSKSFQEFGSRSPMSFNQLLASQYATPGSARQDMNVHPQMINFSQPTPFLTASASFASAPRYGQAVPKSSPCAHLPPPPYPPPPVPTQYVANGWEASNWYHESYAQRLAENNQFF